MPELNRPDVIAQIREQQDAWMAAWIANDRETLDRMLAPEFALVVSARPNARVDQAAWLRIAGSAYTCARAHCIAPRARPPPASESLHLTGACAARSGTCR